MHHGQYCRKRVWIIGEQKAQGKWKSQHPLPDRCFGEHMIDKMSGRFHHTPGTATGAESPALTAEGDQVLMAAAIALDPQEAMLQQPALQVILKLLSDEIRQIAARSFNSIDESWVVLGNDGVEFHLFRLMPVVAWDGGGWRSCEHRS